MMVATATIVPMITMAGTMTNRLRDSGVDMELDEFFRLAEDFPDKPEGMHWRNYDRLYREAEGAQNRSWPPWLIRMLATLNSNTLQEGQQVRAGTTIAKVANPNRLKAELKIPETQTKDVQLGQPAHEDTHNGLSLTA
jgi:hypothetical protein